MIIMNKTLENLKTSPLQRRLSIAKTSLNIGKNWAKSSVSNLWLSKEQRDIQKHQMLQEQADYLASELGKLKGSVVKIGQMLALYGEHFLPKEVIEALHTLDAKTMPLSWSIIESAIKDQLKDRINDFDIDPDPIGTASLAQVHKATHRYTGKQVVLKVQYPNVAKSIDSDLSIFKHLLKITNAVPQTKALDTWFCEMGELLHREVDYRLEAETTKRFAKYLKNDNRYIVPTIYDNYSSDRLICMSFEEGISLNNPQLKTLSQDRRNALGQAAIEIVLRELFEWGEMQTDPNFGNYLVRFEDGIDKLVLLDFGAIKHFDAYLLNIAKSLIHAGYHQDKEAMIHAMQGHHFFDQLNMQSKSDMAEVFLTACEPFTNSEKLKQHCPHNMDEQGRYLWSNSNLYTRVMSVSAKGMQSLSFSLPPKEIMFISRKFIGAYALLVALDARTNADEFVKKFL